MYMYLFQPILIWKKKNLGVENKAFIFKFNLNQISLNIKM